MSVRILLVDDHRVVRAGLKVLLDSQPGWEVCGEADDGYGAIRLAESLEPHIVVMDLKMPRLNGLRATRRILMNARPPKLIALSDDDNQKSVSDLFRAGASGYVLKTSAFEELSDAIEAVGQGKTYLSPKLRKIDVQRPSEPPDARIAGLKSREREALRLLAQGKTHDEAAEQMMVARLTIERHVAQILEKLSQPNLATLLDHIKASKRCQVALESI